MDLDGKVSVEVSSYDADYLSSIAERIEYLRGRLASNHNNKKLKQRLKKALRAYDALWAMAEGDDE